MSLSAIARLFGEKAPWFASTVTSYSIHSGKSQRDQAREEIKDLRQWLDDIEQGINDREQQLSDRGFER